MTTTGYPIPKSERLQPAQMESIDGVLHILQHGATIEEGTARGCLLADEMGLGKTITAIVTANVLKPLRILVIVPANLRENWIREIDRWQTLHHPVIRVKARSEYDLSAITSGWVLINYDILGRHPEIREKNWDLLVVDESHHAKNYAARRTVHVFGGKYKKERFQPIPATKTILLTGTPILNRPDELYVALSYLDSDNWGGSFKSFVNDWYEGGYKPGMVDDNRRVNGTPRDLAQFQAKLRNTVMVRQEKKHALPELPPKVEEPDHLVHPDDVYETPGRLLDWFDTKSRQLMKLWSDLQKATSLADRRCIQKQIQEIIERIRYETAIAKRPAVFEYLKTLTEKTLVFAYHHVIVDRLVEDLRKEGRSVAVVTGKTRDPWVEIDRFQNDPDCEFFIGNLKAAGVGITLTAATRVVFAELDWVPAIHDQAADRAHRIGQTKTVRIVRFIYDYIGATDVWIAAVLAGKKQMTSAALNTVVVGELVKRIGKEPAPPIESPAQ